MNEHQQLFLSKIAGQPQDSNYSDFKIACQGGVFKLHWTVVCPQSAQIAKALDEKFAESKMGNIVHDVPFDPATIFRVVLYLYTQDYDSEVSFPPVSVGGEVSKNAESALPPATNSDDHVDRESNGSEERELTDILIAHIHVYAAVACFVIPNLLRLAGERFKDALNKRWQAKTILEVVEEVYDMPKADGIELRTVTMRARSQAHRRTDSQ